jgi:predicted dehydrogenase
MGNEKTKIGFIGCGRAAQTVHLPYFAESQQCEIKTLVDVRTGLASTLADRYGIPRASGDYRELCDDTKIEAVVMILREPLHAQVAIDLMRAGKHVFTEKPLSDRLLEARRMVAVARETRRLLMVGYMRRYDPGILKARQLIQKLRSSGELGQVTQARIQTHGGGGSRHAYGSRESVTTDETKPLAPKRPSDEIPEDIRELSWRTNFFDTHLGDMVLYLLDPIREVLFADIELDPSRRLFIYDHGSYKTVHTGGAFGVGPRDESLTVYFEQGRLTVWPSANFLRDVHARVELVRGGNQDPVVERPVVEGPWCFQAQAEDFLNCVRTGSHPRCTAEDAMKDVELTHAILRKLTRLDC